MSHNKTKDKFGIIVGGGPAPGINGVISAVTIEAINRGHEVIGIMDGFKHLSAGKQDSIQRLSINLVSRIHQSGGSILRTSRVNPTKNPENMANVINAIKALGIKYLVTIGGEDTATVAYKLSRAMKGQIHVAHAPKTIDNDLPLPGNMPTFGFETARHVGTRLINNLMEDAKTTGRWFFAVTMGRFAGHLTLGIAKAAGATLAVIPEEIAKGASVQLVCDILEGSIIKRLAMGKNYGVAVIAEGIAENLKAHDLESPGHALRDEHGHLRLAEIGFSEFLKRRVEASLKERGLTVAITDKNVGYELRCAPPIPFDTEYTRNLGYAAVKFLLEGGSNALIAIWGGKTTILPLAKLIDPKTGRSRLRLVDVRSENYEVALNYMIRLRHEDFRNRRQSILLARAAKMDPLSFARRFKPAAI